MKAVDLIPVEQRVGTARGAGSSQGGAYGVLAFLALLALLAVVYGIARHQISTRRDKAVALEAQVQSIQANAAKLAPYTSFIALRNERLQAVSQLVNSRFDWAHAFHELGRVMPAQVAITAITGNVGPAGAAGAAASSTSASSAASTASTSSPAAPAAAKAGSVASSTPPGSIPTFTITGCAKTQATVAQTLDRLRLIDGVGTVALQSSTKPAGGGPSTSASNASCPNTYPVFTVQVTFVPLPASTATSSPAVSVPVSSTSKSTGGSR